MNAGEVIGYRPTASDRAKRLQQLAERYASVGLRCGFLEIEHGQDASMFTACIRLDIHWRPRGGVGWRLSARRLISAMELYSAQFDLLDTVVRELFVGLDQLYWEQYTA